MIKNKALHIKVIFKIIENRLKPFEILQKIREHFQKLFLKTLSKQSLNDSVIECMSTYELCI